MDGTHAVSRRSLVNDHKGARTVAAGMAMVAPLFDLANFFLDVFSHLSCSSSESRTLYRIPVLNFFLHACIPCLAQI